MVASAPLHDPARDLYVVPVRHHSPACAAHLETLLAEIRPAAILIEGPCDFDPLIPLICDEQTRAPVAIVALREITVPPATGDSDAGADTTKTDRRITSYFPFCEHSPEYRALLFGATHKIDTRFIDLPSHARAMGDIPDGKSRTLLSDETLFDSGDYVTALAANLGCRDGNEAWDQLFETRIAQEGWRGFFADVAQYCACIRAATPPSMMEQDGTLEREAQMRAIIADARKQVSGPIVAIVGGFHAEALFSSEKARKPVPAAKGAKAYLVRYGNRQLDALSGYSAGLPLPGFYQEWWDIHRNASAGGPIEPAVWTTQLVSGFAAHLRKDGKAPPFPVMLGAIEQAQRLAHLRGRALPMRDDLIDAVRSTFIKEEIGRAGNTLLSQFHDWLTGTAIGDVPPAAGSPPLVEAIRSEARRLRFAIDDGEVRTRNLDIYRKDAHRTASRFCHALDLLDVGFARRTAGPDFRNDVALDRLFEIWSVAWSPMVEARLIELSGTADTLSEAVTLCIADRIAALSAQGLGRNAEAAIDLFATACRAGIGNNALAILDQIEAEIIEDAELRSLIAALSDAVLLRRGHAVLGIDDVAPLDRLVGTIWRRLVLMMPELAALPGDQARPVLESLADLQGIIEIARAAAIPLDHEAFSEALARLDAAELAPEIAGAVMAFALIDGRADGDMLGARLRGELAGAYVKASDKLAFLSGIIAVSREFLWTVPHIVDALDAVVGDADEEEFIALLPHLRLALMPLDPRDIERLSGLIAARLGVDAGSLQHVVTIDEMEVLKNLEQDRQMAALLEAEGVA